MITSHDPAGPAEQPATIHCVLAAYADACVLTEAIPELRKQLVPPCGAPLSANFLKHADEQTYAGLTAVFEAIRSHRLATAGGPSPFRDWGVVGSPRFLGRAAMSSDLPRFLVEGAWDVSPHMIPHRSLHSLSGTVSQALGIKGPNYGAGGGPGAEAEGLLAAVSLLESMHLPGVWLVCTCLDPERSADHATGRPLPGTRSKGLALALMPAGTPGGVHMEMTIGRSAPASQAITLDVLAELLRQLTQKPSVTHPFGISGRLTLRRGMPVGQGPHFALLSPERSLATH